MNNSEFSNVVEQMRAHGMKLPVEKVNISIPGAKEILLNAMKYFIGCEGKELIWLPEYNSVANWLENNKGRGLFLYGNCGRGKSILCRYALPAILLKYSRKVVSVFDVNDLNNNLDEVIKKHIISLDDIGTESVKNNYGEKRIAFAEVMDAAEKFGKLVIISSNLGKDELIERYGERVFDRIISTTDRVIFKGESLRK